MAVDLPGMSKSQPIKVYYIIIALQVITVSKVGGNSAIWQSYILKKTPNFDIIFMIFLLPLLPKYSRGSHQKYMDNHEDCSST